MPKKISFCKGFSPPSQEEATKALGFGNETVPHEYQIIDDLYDLIPEPTHKDDWLAQYNEDAESFNDWKSDRTKILHHNGRSKIYLVQLGDFTGNSKRLLNHLQEYVQAFYHGVEVKLLSKIELVKEGKALYAKVLTGGRIDVDEEEEEVEVEAELYPMTKRVAHPYDLHKVIGEERQLAVSPILRMLTKILPKDAFCMCCVTMQDLYEGSTDSFVGGYAFGGSRVGIFSFCRYDPLYRQPRQDLQEALEGKLNSDELTLLARGCKVLVHEIGHMFNIGHCVYFGCCMNGSGHLQEDFKQPFHLCPIDLRKVQEATKCDVWKRYSALLNFYQKYEMNAEAEWVVKRLVLAQKAGVSGVELPRVTSAKLDETVNPNKRRRDDTKQTTRRKRRRTALVINE